MNASKELDGAMVDNDKAFMCISRGVCFTVPERSIQAYNFDWFAGSAAVS